MRDGTWTRRACGPQSPSEGAVDMGGSSWPITDDEALANVRHRQGARYDPTPRSGQAGREAGRTASSLRVQYVSERLGRTGGTVKGSAQSNNCRAPACLSSHSLMSAMTDCGSGSRVPSTWAAPSSGSTPGKRGYRHTLRSAIATSRGRPLLSSQICRGFMLALVRNDWGGYQYLVDHCRTVTPYPNPLKVECMEFLGPGRADKIR